MKKHLLLVIHILVYFLLCCNKNLMFQVTSHDFNIIGVIIRLILNTSFVLIPLYIYYENNESLSLLKIIILPLSILSLIFMNEYCKGQNYVLNLIIYMIYVTYLLLFIIYNFKKSKIIFSKRLIILFTLTLLFAVPLNVLSFVKPNKFLLYKPFNFWYFLFLSLFILSALILYFFLKKFKPEKREKIIFILSIVDLYYLLSRFSYVQYHAYQDIVDFLGALPLYVCSFMTLLIPFAVASHNKKFLNFIAIFLTPGAIIVFVNPSIGIVTIFNYDVTYFMVTHMLLFSIGVNSIIYLNPELSIKQTLKSSLYFLIYFIMVLVIDMSIFFITRNKYNFSYIETPPIPVDIKNFGLVNINGYHFYPLYILILWIVHVSMAFATLFVVRFIKSKKVLVE